MVAGRISPLAKLEAYAEARGETVPEMLAGFDEDLERRMAAASVDTDPGARVNWDTVVESVLGLPTMDELAVEPSKRVLELKGGLLLLHAFAREPMGNLHMLVGVATFPGEEIDLRRRQAFVVVELGGGVHFLTLDAFERAYEGHSDTERSFPIESIRFRELLGEDEYLLGNFRGEDDAFN